MTRKEIAKKIGMSPGHLSDILNGKRELTIKMAKRISKAFGLGWQEVFFSEDFEKLLCERSK